LPGGAAFCPGCGTATPTEVEKETGATSVINSVDTTESEFRDRLQRALGDAYQLRELIGRGGFGVVYAAWDVQLKREVAIKALRFDLFPTESLVGRFRREAESVAKLRHPNVVPIYSIGQAEGFAYFIMPRLEGTNLADLFDAKERLSIREAHRIFRELAGALAVAHRAGIIHRDIKPENIFLEDTERRALLMDFGIAKTDDGDDAGKLTGTGMVVGTPHYMSPEQATGEKHIDHRSDLYSLGVVAYQLFAGRTPFTEKTAQRLIVERLTSTPDDLAVVNPAVPEDIAAAVMRCLEREPDDRWNSIANLITVLDTVEVPSDEQADLELASAQPIQPLAPKAWIGLSMTAAVLIAAWIATYGIHSAPAIDTPVVTQARAEQIAGDYLANRDQTDTFASRMFAGSLRRTTGFNRASPDRREFLLSTVGFDEARRLANEALPISHWHVRWLAHDGNHQWNVIVGSDGAVREFSVPVDADSSTAQLTEDEARVLAESFLKNDGWDPTSFELRAARSQREAQRIDHFFTWRDRGTTIARTPNDGAPDSAFVEFSVDVSGDRVTSYRREFQLPGSFDTTDVPPVVIGIFAVLVAGCVVYGFALVFAPRRRRLARWRPAIMATGIVLILSLILWVNSIPGNLHSNSSGTVVEFFVVTGWIAVFLGLLIGVAVVMLMMGSMALSRDVFPAHTAEWEGVLSRRWNPRPIAQAVLAGYLVGLAIMAGYGVFNAVLRMLFNTKQAGEAGYLDHVGELAPVISLTSFPVLTGMLTAPALLFLLAMGRHLFKPKAVAIAIPIVLFALLFLPSVFTGQIESLGAILGCVAMTLTVYRLGVLAGAVAMAIIGTDSGLHLIASGQGTYVASGILSLILLLAPGVIAAVAYTRTRSEQPATP
jgi:serine/threonine-protein kinase